MRRAQPESATALDAQRRLLMIGLDFPPAITSGALRLVSFARHLPEHGWATAVVTIRRAFHGGGDDTATADALPPDCQVTRAFGFDTATTLAWRGRYLDGLAFPDRTVSWVVDGVRQALQVCRRGRVDAIFSSSPAVSAHVIAFVVKRITGLPWVADLRDPWNLDVPRGARLRRLDRKLEGRLLSAADRITVVAAGMVDHLERRHGGAVGSKTRLICNGYDEEAMTAALAAAGRPQRFSIVHTGSCQPSYRDPAPFLRAVRFCLDRGQLPPETSIELIGTPADATLRAALTRLTLEPRVRVEPRQSHPDALAATARAAVLLLLQTRPEHDLCIPAKVYEYLRTDRPIIAVARAGSETARQLQGFDGVTLVAPNDVDAIATALGEVHRLWAAGGAGFTRDVARYSRRQLAAAFAAVLDEIGIGAGAPVR